MKEPNLNPGAGDFIRFSNGIAETWGKGKGMPLKMLIKNGKVWSAYDDVTGIELDAEKVAEARDKEIGFVDNKKVWTKNSRAEAKRRGW